MATIEIGGRQHGKTFAAAQAMGVSMDEYRELMRQQRERVEAARQLIPDLPAVSLRDFWLRDEPRYFARDWLREYLCEFSFPPELVGPPAPSFEVWDRNQRRIAREENEDWQLSMRFPGLRGRRWSDI